MTVRHHPSRRRRYLLAAAYGLTSSLVAPTVHTAQCGTQKNGARTGVYRVQSALPFRGDRCVQVATDGERSASSGLDSVATSFSSLDFTTLVIALELSGLGTTLRQGGPFTLFAPTNEAFSDLTRKQRDSLIKEEDLARVLGNHIVPGRLTGADMAEVKVAKTLHGDQIFIDASDGISVNDARVVKADMTATNGVVHVIDQVILPNEQEHLNGTSATRPFVPLQH